MPRGENKYSKINCRERIDDYIESDERIKGMKDLCTHMYIDYFKKRKDDFNIEDLNTFIENLHSNLSQALEGKKGLSVHYVLAMEQFFEKSLYDIIHGNVRLGQDTNQHTDAGHVGIEMQFTGLEIDIARQNVIQNNIFNKA